MKRLLTKLLNLPGVIVEDSQSTSSILILSVRAESKTASCPRCGQRSHRIHQNRGHLVKDLPWSGQEVILKVNRRQFKCDVCQKPFSETLSFVGWRRSFTHRLARKITEEVIHSDLKNVAKNNRLTPEEVWSMLMEIAEEIMPIKVDNLKRIGIDEISLVKGQGKFIVVLVDLDTHKLVALVSSRTQLEIEKILKKWGESVLTQIKEVSMDMSGNYKYLIQKICPNAVITVDRFHVAKMIHEELNQARIDQKKQPKLLKSSQELNCLVV